MTKDEFGKIRKFHARVVFEFDYEADPVYYAKCVTERENLTVKRMIETDKAGAKEDVFLFLSGNESDMTLEITDITEEAEKP